MLPGALQVSLGVLAAPTGYVQLGYVAVVGAASLAEDLAGPIVEGALETFQQVVCREMAARCVWCCPEATVLMLDDVWC